MDSEIIVALVGLVGSVIVALFSYSAAMKGTQKAASENAELIAYRLEQLEQKVHAHNNLVERTFVLEGRMTEVEHDIRDLKGA